MVEVYVYKSNGELVKVRRETSIKKARMVGRIEIRAGAESVCYRREGRLPEGAVRTFWWNMKEGGWIPEEPLREIQRPLFGG